MDAIFYTLPNRNIDYPALSIPALIGKLRPDFEVKQVDLNVRIRDELITYRGLKTIKDVYIPNLIKVCSYKSQTCRYLIRFFAFIQEIELKFGFNYIENVKNEMQNRNYEHVLLEQKTFDAVLTIFRLNSLLHTFFDIYVMYNNDIRNLEDDIIKVIIDNEVSYIIKQSPNLLGFTLLEIQKNFTLFFISLLRERGYKGYISIGGADSTRHYDKYMELYKQIDFAFIKEGEVSVAEVLRYLRVNKRNWEDIPGLAYRNNDQIFINNAVRFQPDEMVTPDFNDLELDKYLTSALPIQASRACYYGKCDYCIHWKTYSHYYERNAVCIVNDLEHLVKKYNTKYFHFTDDALSSELGIQISNEIIKRGLDIRWLVYGRLENIYTKECLEKWYKAGARILEWGFETASQQLLNDMKKNVDIENAKEVLKNSSDIGIINKLFCFHNYPTEKIEDLKCTVKFIEKYTNSRVIRPFSSLRNKLFLLKGSKLYNDSHYSNKFKKVWEPSGIFNVNASYKEFYEYDERKKIVELHATCISDYMKKNKIYATNDENVMLDLVIIDLQEKGNIPFYRCI